MSKNDMKEKKKLRKVVCRIQLKKKLAEKTPMGE